MEFGVGVIYKNFYVYNFCEKRSSGRHTLLKGVHRRLPLIYIFLYLLGWNAV